MRLHEFSSICHQFWDNYFRWVTSLKSQELIDSDGGVILFPRILLCTETKNYLIAELLGASEMYRGLVVKERRQDSVTEYFAQFPDESTEDTAFRINGRGHRFINLCLSHEVNVAEALSRFPALNLYKSRIVRTGSRSGLLGFGPDFSDMSLSNCILINTDGEFYRAKHISELLILSDKTSGPELNRKLLELVNSDDSIKGVISCEQGFEQDYILASQLQSLYLTPHLHETTIGEFFNRHPELLSRVLETDSILYEPYLEWIDKKEGNDDQAINPDMMFRRGDGFYDILDFKTALLGRRKTTKGERKRRRFVDAVNEGIAQLANYAEYFQFEANRQRALEKYNVLIDKPRLYLVVGHYDNTSRDEVEQALRPYTDVCVLDYDSIVQMFLARATSSVKANGNV